MEKEIKSQYPEAEVVLKEGSKGIFDVKIDGKLIFSKYKTGRFPTGGEINSLMS